MYYGFRILSKNISLFIFLFFFLLAYNLDSYIP